MNKEEFYQNINENTFVGADFCRKLYGYCYTDDTFLERVMDKFKSFGRDKVVYIFSTFATLYIHFQMEEKKDIAHWYAAECKKRCEKKEKEGENNGARVGDWHRFKGFPSI